MTNNQLSGEPAGTVLLGSIDKRAYLFLCQSAERMKIERQNARQYGIQDPVDFVFEFDGVRHEVSYERLKYALTELSQSDDGPCTQCNGSGWDKQRERACDCVATPEPQTATGWQPIETSPSTQDLITRKRFLIATSEGQVLVVEPHPNGWVYSPYDRFGSPAQKNHTKSSFGPDGGDVATHWMPLPDLPTSSRDSYIGDKP